VLCTLVLIIIESAGFLRRVDMGIGSMKKTPFAILMATGMLAASLLLPVPPTFAQTPVPPPETRPPETRLVEPRADRDRTGLWGLLGLAGLLGLTGLGRRRERVHISTDARERNRV
jgi:hypothetical protein